MIKTFDVTADKDTELSCPNSGYETTVNPDECENCGNTELVMEFNTSDVNARMICSRCGRATIWFEDERECGDCDDCQPHHYEIECDRHGDHTLECPGCSCLDDSCECSCCITESAFYRANDAWNSDSDIKSAGAPWCSDCDASKDDCKCVFDPRVGPNGSYVAVDSEWENT